jgi:aryl-alcohol dehydrogenase-like predicted oxidoreductase
MDSATMQDILASGKTVLGKTGYEVTPMSFGAGSISGEGGGYGFGDISEADSIDLVQYAYDLGINLFDTAPIYGYGMSENRLGKAVKSFRDKVWLTSKSGVHWDTKKRVRVTNDPKITEQMFLQSLKDLNTEYIDLYFVHWPDENVDIRRPLEVIKKYQDKGVIKHIGLCNTNIEDLKKSTDVCAVEVAQSEFHLFNQSASNELFPYLKEENIGFMSWGTLDKGILTGKYDTKKKREASDCRGHAPWWNYKEVEKKVNLVDEMKEFIKDTEYQMMDLSIAFNLSQESLNTVLIGARSKNQLEGNIKSIGKAQKAMDEFKNWSEIKEIASKF